MRLLIAFTMVVVLGSSADAGCYSSKARGAGCYSSSQASGSVYGGGGGLFKGKFKMKSKGNSAFTPLPAAPIYSSPVYEAPACATCPVPSAQVPAVPMPMAPVPMSFMFYVSPPMMAFSVEPDCPEE